MNATVSTRVSGVRWGTSGLMLTLLLVLGTRIFGASPSTSEVTPALRERAVEALREAFQTQTQWKRVHAAEALLRQGYDREKVLATFEEELRRAGDEPKYRIGIRRVLARASTDPVQRQQRIDDIVACFLDSEGPDRVHAAETLGKLGWKPAAEQMQAFVKAAESGETSLAAYACWPVANADPAKGQNRLAALLDAADPGVRGQAAYVLRHQQRLQPGVWEQLVRAADKQEDGSNAQMAMVGAACIQADPAHRAEWKKKVLKFAETGTPGQRYQACLVLGQVGDASDVPLLKSLLDAEESDVRVGAAVALLRIDRRRPRSLAGLDWVVILLYALGMLLVGWYYSGRTQTQDDYLLGGRAMRPWAVGLSLFATLLSTISYLAVPGEMIKHGPMIVSSIFVLPVIAVIVGWGLIPFFMRLKVTTAYEILEQRLGVSTRILGSLIFLVLRLMWMAVIIYATTSKVLVPLLGWSEATVPWICAVLGILTVIYTSMGGLRAVVFTDVVQTFILFGGAVLAIFLISTRLGGVGAWWPTAWAPTWDPPKFWFDPSARITVAAVWLSTLVWYVCTAGSDQMAIQRYLATRDTKAARRMYFTSMAASAAVSVFLAALGLALFAYFRTNPYLIPDGQNVSTYADRLFTRFIISGLPAGVSGLIIAGLLAAAMSSLSSGVNSSCSVVAVDFVERFRRSDRRAVDPIRLARASSWAVGLVVVLLSAGVVFVQGNLLEVTYKVVNLLVTPLFILFLMALFVPWATTFGTWIGTLSSTAVAIGIAFFHWFDLSFIWIMPGSLLVGAVAGTLASLVPIGRKGVEAGGNSPDPAG